jgi:hypothetical protein
VITPVVAADQVEAEQAEGLPDRIERTAAVQVPEAVPPVCAVPVPGKAPFHSSVVAPAGGGGAEGYRAVAADRIAAAAGRRGGQGGYNARRIAGKAGHGRDARPRGRAERGYAGAELRAVDRKRRRAF